MFYATNQVMLSGEFFETMKGVGTKLIEKLVSEIPEDVPHKSICVVGIPGETASDIAKSEEVDLIVMGNSGKGAFNAFVTGSVSQYVIHHVECPVLIVK